MADEIKDGKVDVTRYMVKEGEKVNLKKYSTKCDVSIDKSQVKNLYFPQVIEKLKDLQEKLYAQNTYGLVVVLQAMDAAGKDGTINHVFASLNPGGVKVVSFKQPTTEEKDHDYMWRINKALPERGDIGIFNRSQYEDVIVTRIHDLVHQGQLPQNLVNKNIWEERYEQINNWEKYLRQNGFMMIKIFLHVSKEEQQKRLNLIVNIVVSVAAVVCALAFTNVIDLLSVGYTIMLSGTLVPLLGGIIWKRGTTKGAAASAAVGMITALLSIFGVITVPFSSIFPVLPGVVAYIVVSLCTKHAPTENTAKVADVVMASTSEKSNNAAN